jgi:hypothetical protein
MDTKPYPTSSEPYARFACKQGHYHIDQKRVQMCDEISELNQ